MADMIYVGTLDRFGYVLRVVTTTKKEAKELLLKEYKKAYLDINKVKPSKEEVDTVKDEMFVDKVAFGKVEWT